jgi:hypothetical protein
LTSSCLDRRLLRNRPTTRLEETNLADLPDIFGNGRQQIRQQAHAAKDELYKQIGQLKLELDLLKQSWPYRLKTSAHESIRNIRI